MPMVGCGAERTKAGSSERLQVDSTQSSLVQDTMHGRRVRAVLLLYIALKADSA